MDSHPGNESHALVEFAPFQKVPIEKKKVDARNNTIDQGETGGSLARLHHRI